MKNAFVALVLTLVSSSAFAQLQSTCETNLLLDSTSVKAEAQSFVNDVEEMAQMQIAKDGVSSINGDTLGRVEKAKQIIETVTAVEQRTGNVDANVLSALCDANLNVMEAISR